MQHRHQWQYIKRYQNVSSSDLRLKLLWEHWESWEQWEHYLRVDRIRHISVESLAITRVSRVVSVPGLECRAQTSLTILTALRAQTAAINCRIVTTEATQHSLVLNCNCHPILGSQFPMLSLFADLSMCLRVSSLHSSLIAIHFSDSCLHFPNTLSLLQVINIYNSQIGRIGGFKRPSIGLYWAHMQITSVLVSMSFPLCFMTSVGGLHWLRAGARLLVNKRCAPVIQCCDQCCDHSTVAIKSSKAYVMLIRIYASIHK